MKFFSFIILLLGLSACRYTFSPYAADVPETRLNDVNLRLIQDRETTVGANFKIAVISDTHNYFDELKLMVEKINRRGPYAFVIVTGDISNIALAQEFKKTQSFLDNLSFPVIVLAGNHDMVGNGQVVFERMYGPDRFSLVYKNLHLLTFNNNNWEVAGKLPDLDWVEEELTKDLAPLKILFAHIDYKDRERYSRQQISRTEQLLNDHNVSLYVSGHNHNEGTRSYGVGTQITVGAASKRVYVELNVTAGGVTHQFVRF